MPINPFERCRNVFKKNSKHHSTVGFNQNHNDKTKLQIKKPLLPFDYIRNAAFGKDANSRKIRARFLEENLFTEVWK